MTDYLSILSPSLPLHPLHCTAQVQSSLNKGIQDFVSEAQRTQQQQQRLNSSSSDANDRLAEEVRLLRETVGRLEGSLASISGVVTAMSDQLARSSAVMQVSEEPAPIPREDAFTLLSKGLVSDAVVRVLEDKDIATTVALLDRLTTQQVNNECSHLERLCITQQLATDMSVNKPVEVTTIIISIATIIIISIIIALKRDECSDFFVSLHTLTLMMV